MIKQIGVPLGGRPILLIARMITERIGLDSVLLPLSAEDTSKFFILKPRAKGLLAEPYS